jgi:hypothetical protein
VASTNSQRPFDDGAVRPKRRSRWWIAALTFVAGVAIGVLIVGFLDRSTSDFSAAQSAPSTSPSPVVGQSSEPAAASAQVNAACLRVINHAQDVATILSEVGPAITAVNLQQLDDIVRRLQSIQTRLEVDLRDCKVNAEVNSTPTAAPSPLSTVDPSASPMPLPTASPNR